MTPTTPPTDRPSHGDRAADYRLRRDRLAFQQQIRTYCQAMERQCLAAFDQLHEGRSPDSWIN